MKIKIIYQDDDLLVIDKPAGLVVNRSATVREPTLQDWLWQQGLIKLDKHMDEVFKERFGLAHRIDRDTSGVLLVAKHPKALNVLLTEFKQRQVTKEYIALVHGFVPLSQTIDMPIRRHPANKRTFTVFIGGRPSVTTYKLGRTYYYKDQPLSLVTVWPKTGRTHQIRVHFKYINHPLVGDKVYAGRKLFQLSRRITPRIFLHAIKIWFKHPATGKQVSFVSPLPEDLEQVLSRLTPQE